MWQRWTFEATSDGWAVMNAAGDVVEVCAAEWQARVTCEMRNERLTRQTRYEGQVL